MIRALFGLLVVLAGCSAGTTGPQLTATLTAPTDITLTWRPTDPAAAGQIVEYTNEAGSPYTILAFVPPDLATYRHPDLIPQTPFYYRIRPYYGTASTPVNVTLPPGDVDQSTSDNGDWARPATIPGGPPAVAGVRDPRSAPTALTPTIVNPNGIHFTWTDNSTDEEGFFLEVRTPGETLFRVAAVLDPNVTSFGLTTLESEKQAAYQVRPIRYGPPTNVAHQTTGGQSG
ncbi:fibronectin type III domain-containing protein [Actinocrispum wychmicini]|uniref:Fibronectin type-III domain-containing protein n=1 Tax=Actinocrispum wychmicini TaxID=1213861 RepID=A0A4V2S685_9PSEU|nr:fibronectin type III domain-containing protein [Actinocrispum wychmicini]TCO55060.1 hypothetical protein EV192_108348 [Actinocrispum wychmicini]